MTKKIFYELKSNKSKWGVYYPYYKHMDKKINEFLTNLFLQFKSKCSYCICSASFSGIYNKVDLIEIRCSDTEDNLRIAAIFKSFLVSHECFWR